MTARGRGLISDQLDSIFDGCDGQCVALQLCRFITEQLGDFGPEILDLLGRTREPHRIQETIFLDAQILDAPTDLAFFEQVIFVDVLPTSDGGLDFVELL